MRISDWSSDVCSSDLKGFLTRRRCETDRRVVNLELTETGREVVNDILPAVANAFNTHLAGFSNQEIETLLNLLSRVIANGSCKPESDSQRENYPSRTSPSTALKIGRASCRERVCQYV